MKTRDRKIPIVLALCLTVMAVVIPSIGLGVDCTEKPSHLTDMFNITVVRVATAIDYADPAGPANDPSAAVWASAPTTTVELGYKIIANVNNLATGNDTFCGPEYGTRNLMVKSIHDGMTILFRIEFADPTSNILINDPPL